MINSQSQTGGNNSTNMQANQMVVHMVGIDEKRAREIYQEMNLQLRKDYSQEALNIANARVNEFENKLLPKMQQVDGALEAFADPSFQLLLVEAQKTAASTERPEDYDLLSELLIHRFQKGENRITRAGISIAVGIVDKVSDEALLGLTVAHAICTFIPITGEMNSGLNVLDDLFAKIIYGKLPSGKDWLDHLDILNAVRINNFGGMKKIQQFYPEKLPGYVDVGIDKKSENFQKAAEILSVNGLPNNILIDALNNDFVRVCCSNKDLTSLHIQHQVIQEGQVIMVTTPLSDTQIKAVESLFDLYSQDGNLKQNNINLFMEEWDKRPHLKILKDWWDSISTGLTITSVGKVLAHSNAQRCDSTLPSLN